MQNRISANATTPNSFDFKNLVIAVTVILTVVVCYCVTVIINAKNNRNVELSYKDFSLSIEGPQFPVSPVVPA